MCHATVEAATTLVKGDRIEEVIKEMKEPSVGCILTLKAACRL